MSKVLTEEEIAKYRSGIAAYAEPQESFKALLRERGKITDDEFDKEFSSVYRDSDGKTLRRANRWFWPMTGDSFILGGMNPTERNRMLHLVQVMVALGDVVTSTEDGHVVYRLAPESSDMAEVA